jgi:hypothetical protein
MRNAKLSFTDAMREQWRKYRWIAVAMPLALPVGVWFFPPPPDYSPLLLAVVCVGFLCEMAVQIGLTLVVFALVDVAFDRFWPLRGSSGNPDR